MSSKQRRAATVAPMPSSPSDDQDVETVVEETAEAVESTAQTANTLLNNNAFLPNAEAAVDFFKGVAQSSVRSTQQWLKGLEEIRSTQLSTIQNLGNDLQQVVELTKNAETVDDLTQIPARMAMLSMQRWSEQMNRLVSVVVAAETNFVQTAQSEWMELAKRVPQSLPFPNLGVASPVDSDAVHNLSNYLESAQLAYTQVAGLWADMAKNHRPQ